MKPDLAGIVTVKRKSKVGVLVKTFEDSLKTILTG